MQIDWFHFTPWASLSGGLLIGAGVAVLLLLEGRVAGISGIVGGIFRGTFGEFGDAAWRIAFVLGLVAAPLLFASVMALPESRIDASPPLLALAGLLVGFGSRLGSGCTSGHGVCGLARLSPRSLAATLTFMAAGFATVFVLRHVLG